MDKESTVLLKIAMAIVGLYFISHEILGLSVVFSGIVTVVLGIFTTIDLFKDSQKTDFSGRSVLRGLVWSTIFSFAMLYVLHTLLNIDLKTSFWLIVIPAALLMYSLERKR